MIYITQIIEGETYYFTGGVTKSLPLFSKHKHYAYDYKTKELALQKAKTLNTITDLNTIKVIEE